SCPTRSATVSRPSTRASPSTRAVRCSLRMQSSTPSGCAAPSCGCSRTRRSSPTWRPVWRQPVGAMGPTASSTSCRRRSPPRRRRRRRQGSVDGMISPDLDQELPDDLGSVHFVGIGGSGMSGIARLLLEAGHRVTGSDVRESDAVARLREAGATIAIGHDAANVGDADTVVVTGALWQDNPEYRRALESGIPVLHRSLALNWLIRGHRVVSVAGAHGKTTSTGMIVTALRELGADPGFVNGGVIAGIGRSSAYGSDDLFVVEADESDGPFLLYDTAVALITNVDADHLDHYGTQEAFEDAFVRFARQAREVGVAWRADPGTLAVTRRLVDTRVVTFGYAEDAEVRVRDVVAEGPVGFTSVYGGREVNVRLAIPGAHNAVNAAGAFAVLAS